MIEWPIRENLDRSLPGVAPLSKTEVSFLLPLLFADGSTLGARLTLRKTTTAVEKLELLIQNRRQQGTQKFPVGNNDG